MAGSSDQLTGYWRPRIQETAEARALVQKDVRAELAQLKRLKAAGVASWNEVTKEKREQQQLAALRSSPRVLCCVADGFRRHRHLACHLHACIFRRAISPITWFCVRWTFLLLAEMTDATFNYWERFALNLCMCQKGCFQQFPAYYNNDRLC